MTITIQTCGGNKYRLAEEQQRAGVSAARDVFSAHGRTAEYCAEQNHAQANDEDYDAPALQTWCEAERAAMIAIDSLDGDTDGASLVWEG
jgi:hypothetical protein